MWRESLIVPLCKGGSKDKTDPDSYRPVSLLCTPLKIFEKILYNRIKFHSDVLSKINCQQQGFISKLSCLTASFNLQETIHYFLENHSKVYAAFLDSRKAFDTVWRKGLMFKLHEIGIDGKLWYSIDDMHINTSSAVVVNSVMSSSFVTSQGVRQGGVLSGFLYIVYINELLQDIEHVFPNFGIPNANTSNPSYADDIACLNDSPKGLQVLLNTCYSYSCKWRFNFNAKKSVVIMFEYTRTHVHNRHLDRYQWYIGIETIPVVDSCKHLGITLDRRLTNACRVHEACSRARKSYFSLKSNMPGTVNPLTATSLYRKVILPSLLYGCELWNELSVTDTKKLSQLQHFLVKDMHGFETRTRSDMCESMLGLLEIVREIDKRKLLFFCKLCHLQPATNTKNIFS